MAKRSYNEAFLKFPFATTWLCETGFSAMCVLKTKHRNRLKVEDDLRLCLSKVMPRFQKLALRASKHSLRTSNVVL